MICLIGYGLLIKERSPQNGQEKRGSQRKADRQLDTVVEWQAKLVQDTSADRKYSDTTRLANEPETEIVQQ